MEGRRGRPSSWRLFRIKGRWRRVVPPPGVDFQWKEGSTLRATSNGREEGSSLLLASILNGREMEEGSSLLLASISDEREMEEGCPSSWRLFRREGRSSLLLASISNGREAVDFKQKGGGGGSSLLMALISKGTKGLSLLLVLILKGREVEEGSLPS